jgi:hypothetical protein
LSISSSSGLLTYSTRSFATAFKTL